MFVIADDVPHALALIAASGDNYEGLIYALTYSDAERGQRADTSKTARSKRSPSVETYASGTGPSSPRGFPCRVRRCRP